MARLRNKVILTTLSANGQTSMVSCGDFRNITVSLYAASSAALTIKTYASNANLDNQPDLSAAVSTTNEYAPEQMTDLDTGINVDGSTGVVYSGASDGWTRYEINDNNAEWIGFKVSGYTAGNITVKLSMTNNQ